jgi:hypothetical protein
MKVDPSTIRPLPDAQTGRAFTMSFQPLFRKFNEAIQLTNFNKNAELRKKRDAILDRLRKGLSPQHKFTWFNQGSYQVGTGVRPLKGDYDIDVGIEFPASYRDHDPVIVKGWVYEAVKPHTARVEWRNPCITVYYQEGGEPIYHVDLAVLAKDPDSKGHFLALGKQHSSADLRKWQPDHRKSFMEDIENKFSGEDAGQLCRVIRYLKRWRHVHFASEGSAAPTGISLTIAAYLWFRPTKVPSSQLDYDDLGATTKLVGSMLGNFRPVQGSNGGGASRLTLPFPRIPHDDVCKRMSNQQMQELHGRLVQLRTWLEEARRSGSPELLQRAFGSQFPAK